jgi:hypothetical protein
MRPNLTGGGGGGDRRYPDATINDLCCGRDAVWEMEEEREMRMKKDGG